jgi:hypothetical protein
MPTGILSGLAEGNKFAQDNSVRGWDDNLLKHAASLLVEPKSVRLMV